MAMRATAKEFLSIIVRVAKRALCNGKTSAFQADDAGSIPAARSIIGEVYAHIAQSALEKVVLNSSKDPNLLSIASANAPEGIPPPLGDIIFQNKR